MKERVARSPRLLTFLLALAVLHFLKGWRPRVGRESSANPACIAYFLQVSDANIGLLPRLLYALYHPENYYAIHLDRKIAGPQANAALLKVYRVLGQRWGTGHSLNVQNVVVLRGEVITYRGATMTMNYLTGINRLLAEGDWDYFVNLSGADYPTASQKTIRRLLGGVPARNFVEWKPRGTWSGFAEKRLGAFYVDTGLAKIRSSDSAYVDGSGVEISSQSSGGKHVPNPLLSHLDYTIAKTSGWFILSREFCEHLRGDSDARKMMVALSFSDASDEHLFGTVLWNAGPRWRESVVPSNMRSIFFVAPNGSFALGADGLRSRQHPFWVDDVDEADRLLFWEELKRAPRFFTRKVRGDGMFRTRVDREMIGIGSISRGDLQKLKAYESSLEEQFGVLIESANRGRHQEVWIPEEDSY